jgi:hypothetical protein
MDFSDANHSVGCYSCIRQIHWTEGFHLMHIAGESDISVSRINWWRGVFRSSSNRALIFGSGNQIRKVWDLDAIRAFVVYMEDNDRKQRRSRII